MDRYNPKQIEPKWQKKWTESKIFHVQEDPKKPKKYVIDMFPYPSGAAMHVGHVRNFTISDVISQYLRQKGYNVMHTMGWDTFGLPAENYAIKTGTPPAQTTKANIENFRHQLQQLGMSYDWSREVNTSDPEYYRWTQWIFTQLFENDLAYQSENPQWWCPECKTVLANEQVVNGCCWRHEETPVIKKQLKQWFFKITDYADQLLNGIDSLDWPEKIKVMQRNWIGKSVGADVKFDVLDTQENITVFTTRPDTLFGATYMVLAPEHPLVNKITLSQYKAEVEKYQKESAQKSDLDRQIDNKEKTGVFTGAFAINPVNKKQIPIWIADYVMMGYGTGAIMAVPAHDERDWKFAKKFNLPIVRVIQNATKDDECTTDEGVMMNSDEYNSMNSDEAREKIVSSLAKDKLAKEVTNYKMRDWLISRQRYWGAPIPIIYCAKDGAVAVPEKDLPVILPDVKSFEPTGEGSVLASVDEWVNTKCPKCGKDAKRETDTMDGYACSSWYFLRYTDPKNDNQAWAKDKADYWLPIDYYCGGDHAVSHLLYSRFWMHFFADQGFIEHSRKEPVGKLVYNGYILAHDGSKMSKSRGNVVNPDDLIEQGYGADSLRLFEMFIAPYEQNTNWNTNGVPGTFRFLQRVWTLVSEFLESKENSSDKTNQNVLNIAHKTIMQISSDLDRLSFNTAVASLMESVNSLYKEKANSGFGDKKSWDFALNSLTQLLAPFAPHIAEELWEQLGNKGSVHVSNWPVHDEKYLTQDEITIVVQVNGKLRGQIKMPSSTSQEDIIKSAKSDSKVATYLEGKTIKKEIYVPNKLVNLVVY